VLHYNPAAPPVLRGVSIDIYPREKIGIIGRTGAGKSTLMNSLLRMYELTEGGVNIDGLDIKTIGLHRAFHSVCVVVRRY
jgi:ABC-type multidrug transport system fused ATPase/permease subunit